MASVNSGDFLTPTARLAFSDGLFETKSLDGQKFNYGCTLIFDEKNRAALKAKVIDVVKRKWGDKGVLDFDNGRIKSPLLESTGPQAHSKASGERWPGFEDGTFFIRANSQEDSPPQVLYRSKHIPATKDEVYSGCYGVAVLNCYSWEHPTQGRGVSFGLRRFQKTKDGESLGGRTPLSVDKFFVEIPDDEEPATAGHDEF